MQMRKIAKGILLLSIFGFLYFFVFSILVFKIHNPVESNITYDLESVRTLSNHEEYAYLVEDRHFALSIRLALIETATTSIDVSYYTIHDDDSRDLLFGALLEAADRGVEVRLIIDGTMHRARGPEKEKYIALSAHDNISVKLFDEVSFFKPHAANNVLHDKLLIIDKQYGLTDGRNIGDRYYKDSDDLTAITYDRDVLVFSQTNDSNAVISMKDYYDELFTHDYAQEYHYSTHSDFKRVNHQMRNAFNNNKQSHDYETLITSVHEEGILVDNITFMRSPLNRMQKDPVIMRHLSELASEYDDILLQSPYIIFSDPMRELMPDTTGKNIKILTNNIHYSPNTLATSGYFRYRNELAKNTSLYEYQSKTSMHTKTLLLGDDITVIGSVNLDPRSAFLSTESVVVIYSEAFNNHTKLITSQYLDQSLQVDENGAYLPNATVQGVEKRPKRVSIIRAISLFTYFFDEML